MSSETSSASEEIFQRKLFLQRVNGMLRICGYNCDLGIEDEIISLVFGRLRLLFQPHEIFNAHGQTETAEVLTALGVAPSYSLLQFFQQVVKHEATSDVSAGGLLVMPFGEGLEVTNPSFL